MEKPEPLLVVCALLEHEGKVLVARRGPSMRMAGYWEFPGGKVETNESAEAALVREIKEELGLEIEVGVALPASDWDDGKRHIRLLPFLCRLLRGELRLLEHDAIEWVAPHALMDRNWAPADIPVVQHFLKMQQAPPGAS
ncbi:MAG: hypothetical protein C0424_01635 [Sphingobacteriaceae bacterium]|nr:hypothetical protein [Sphingobacteriaceae bacterium]